MVKTHDGQRLFLNIAQPESDPPLTNAPFPAVLDEAIATAEHLSIGRHEFLPLRRAHAKAAIPLRIGKTIIESLSESEMTTLRDFSTSLASGYGTASMVWFRALLCNVSSSICHECPRKIHMP